MSDSERSPLLGAAKDKGKGKARDSDSLSEATPLLSSSSATPRYDGEADGHVEGEVGDAASVRSNHTDVSASTRSSTKRRSSTPWPSIIAIVTLTGVAVAIMFGAFFVPAAVEEYTKQAAVLEPTNLSLESITTNGVRARIQANFRLDGSRVHDDTSRRIGRAATWLVRSLGTDSTNVTVYLPDYGGAVLGSAVIPPLTISIVDGENTLVDFVAELAPGDAEGIRTIANDWLDGKLDQLRLLGKADVALRSGIIPLGTHPIAESLVFEAKEIPSIPEYNISRLVFRDVPLPGDEKKSAVGADITVTAFNEYPVQLDIPSLGFEILVPNCNPIDPYILVADAITTPVAVRPRSEVVANAQGVVRELPESLTRACPNSNSSPLDHFIDQYLHGDPATVFVRGKKLEHSDTPDWIGELLSSITVPIPFPGRTFDSLIKEFSLTDVDFKLPDSSAEPGDPASNPMVSGTILVTAALPSEMNFAVNVSSIRATADVYHKKQKFGELNIQQWQPANSTKIAPTKKQGPLLKIQSRVTDAPLNITDGDVFTDIIQSLIFGGKTVMLDVDAAVDVEIQTVLGQLILKKVPAQGKIPVKPLPRGAIGNLKPQIGSIQILSTSPTAVHLQALVNLTNPTPYSAHVPYINIHVMKNGSVVGEAIAENLELKQGNNTDLLVSATWDPSTGGADALQVGRDLISQYLSGYNVSVDIKAHRDSIPYQPRIGEALAALNITIVAPRLSLPGDDDGDDDDGDGSTDPENKGRFIRDATFHIFSSTASFTLVSPLHNNTIVIESVNATAFYNHTEPVGRIEYDDSISVPPGASKTPKLPVDWSVGGVGYEAVRKALGGNLKLDAKANVSVRLGDWTERVWYEGQGIGASIRL